MSHPYHHSARARAGRLGLIVVLVLSLIFPPTLFSPQAVWAAFIEAPAEHMSTTAATHYGMAVGDVDSNGTPDVVVAVGGQSRLLLNDGRGRLTEVTGTHLPTLDLTALAPILCDVEGDGDPDLLLANAAGRNRLLINDGQGRFTDATTNRLPNQAAVSMQMACGDVDGDGDLDLVVANRGSQHWLWLNDGQGVFTDASAIHLPRTSDLSYAVRLADVDGNGTLDAVIINYKRPHRLWRNNGLGLFTDVTATHLPGAASDSNDGTLADVDGDGDLDLLVAAGRDALRLWLNDGHGIFTEATTTHLPTLQAFGIKVATGDIDGDGTPDIVLATARQSQLLLNDGTGHFQNTTAALLPIDTRRSFGLAVWDADGDLDLDIVLATPNGPLRLWLNDTTTPRLRVAAAPAMPEVGKPVILTVDAFDEDGLAIATLTLTDPGGTAQEVDLRSDLVDHRAAYTFTPTQVGAYTASVTVTDPSGHATTRHAAFTVHVPDTAAPQVTVTVAGPTPVLVGQPVLLRVTAIDDRGVARTTLTVNATPVPLASDGTATYTPVASGPHTAVAQATDAAGNGGTGSVSFAVEADTAAPVVRVAVTPAVADLTRPVAITVTATDNVAITTRTLRVTGPAIPDGLALTLDAAGRATYTPFQPGTYTLTATARDPAGQTGTGTATLTAQGVADTTPPMVQLVGVPTSVAVGHPVTLTVHATDNVGVTATTLLMNDTPQPLDAAGRVTYTPRLPGTYAVVAWAQDAAGNQGQAQATFQALDATQDTEPPVVALNTPGADAEITAPTEVRGTVTDTTLVRWTLAASPRGEGRWTTVATGTTAVVEGVLGTFDPTLLVNDLYELRLSAEDATGRTAVTTTVVRVAGRMKIGHLSFTLEDLAIPLVGLPITINRTYDSRDTRPGDFGAGWRLDIQTTKVRTGRPLGTDWAQAPTQGTFPPSYCLEIDPTRSVTITLPDGRQDVFDLVPTTTEASRTGEFGEIPAPCQWLAPVEFATAVYQARPGTYSTLEALTDNTLWVVGGLLLSLDTFDVYAPTRFRLTTPEGLALELDQTHGVERLTDPHGNTLTFGPGGILHAAGTSVVFTRDGQGRITTITDPLGHTLTYTYDGQGDLVAVTDQEGHTTRYTYDATHKLVAIEDPRGVTVARTLYDEAGRLIAHIDAEGHRIDYTHNIAGRQDVVRDRLGHVTVSVYDDRGNVLRQTDPLGQTITWTYDARDNVLSETDAFGQTTTYTYDVRGNRLTETNPLGHTTTYAYDAQHHLVTITDPLRQSTLLTYDPAGNLRTVTAPSGSTETYTADATGNPVTLTDSLGAGTTLHYDRAGRVRARTDALGRLTTYTYDANGNQRTETSTRTAADGQTVTLTTTMVYDRKNRLIQTIDPAGHSTFTDYNAVGQVVARRDTDGHLTTYTYDVRGQPLTTTFPDGTTETFVYDANGQRTRWTDRAGRTTVYDYDAAGRLTQTTFPDGSRTHTDYDAAGREVATTDERGHRTAFTYDALGHVTAITDALGATTRWTHDAVGRVLSLSDAQGQTTTFHYAAGPHPIRTTFPDGTFTTATYDHVGRKVAATDQAGHTTRFAYDALGRLLQVTNALGGQTTFTYDEVGHRLTHTDANGRTTRWAYDNVRRVVARTLPLGMTETFTYDPQGNLLTSTDGTGATVTRTYDSHDRLLQEDFPDGNQVTYTYTPTGQRTAVTDARGVTTYHYDARDRLVEVRHPEGTFLRSTYDAAGNRTTLTTPAGATASTYDAVNRLRTVTGPDGGVTAYTYDVLGQRTHLAYPNGTVTTYQYDPLRRIRALATRTAAGTLLAGYTYTFDPTGRRLRVIEHPAAQVDYAYDALGRLMAETRQDATAGLSTAAYTYDAVGNRLSMTTNGETVLSTYDANDRLHTAGTAAFTYDLNGHLVQQTADGVTTAYTYDGNHRLHTVRTPTHQVEYLYDADGHRVETSVDGAVTEYLVDVTGPLAQVVEERASTGAVLARYVHGAERISQTRQGATAYYHADGVGSTRGLTNAAAQPTDTYTYDAFGALRAGTGQTPNPYLFMGEAFDPLAGLYYLRARYLQPTTGRFLTMDPFPGDPFAPVTLHRYLYAAADPVNMWDPSGQVVTLAETAAANSLRNLLAGIQTTTGFGLLDLASEGEDAAYLGLALGLATPAIGVVLKPLIKVAKTRARVGGWLSIHEGSKKSGLGHTISKHIGLTDQDLVKRISQQNPPPGVSTYFDQHTAEEVILATLKQHKSDVKAWLKSSEPSLKLDYQGTRVIGRGIQKGQTQAQITDRTNAVIVLFKGPPGIRPWHVHTSYPVP